MRRAVVWGILFLVCVVPIRGAVAPSEVSFRLGRQLLIEGRAQSACTEFRRAAYQAPDAASDFLLHAAYAALQASDPVLAQKLLMAAEDSGVAMSRDLLLLYADAAALAGDTGAELYYLELLRELVSDDAEGSAYVKRRHAAVWIAHGDAEEATQLLCGIPGAEDALARVEAYQAQAVKRPWLGGVLGMVPGAGYWYSGEVANGFRSLILNGLFLAAMAYAAEEDHWGAFAGLAFFEITWYSGSIYGGIDAAHRYNRRGVESCVDDIAPPSVSVDSSLPVPTFGLRIEL